MLAPPRQIPGIVEPGGTGSGISAAQHENLDTLVHNLSETTYQELLYSGNKLTSATYWTTPGKTLKIRESTFTYTGNKLTGSVKIQYNGAGAVVQTLTSTYSYSGNQLVSVDVVRT
jgi:hypothetical protein